MTELNDIQSYINSIDFSLIKKKMVSDGWRKKDVEQTCVQYRNFLYLNRKYPQYGLLPPSEDIDEFWHYHILDTKKYSDDCQKIFGEYWHHYPYLVLDKNLDQKQLEISFELTQTLYQKEFGEPIFMTRSRFAKVYYKVIKILGL